MKDFYPISPFSHACYTSSSWIWPYLQYLVKGGNYELLIIPIFLTVNTTHSLTVIRMYHSLLTIKIGHLLNDHGSYTVKY
jgi:hypothetical protein